MYGIFRCKLMQTHFFCADKRNGFPIPKKSRRGISSRSHSCGNDRFARKRASATFKGDPVPP